MSLESSSVGMSPPEQKACAQLFTLVKDYLHKLSFCNTFLEDLSSNEEESVEFLTQSFALLRELKKKGVVTENLEECYSKYKAALEKLKKNKDETLNSLLKREYSGDQEWVDEVNYIYVWALNNYGLNLKTNTASEIQEKFTISLSEPEAQVQEETEEKKTGKRASSHSYRSSRSRGYSGSSIYRNIFRTGKYDFGDQAEGEDENSFEYVVSKIQAWERLEKDIKSGRVYIYIGKPVRNPKLKKWFSHLCILGLILSGAAFLEVVISAIFKGNKEKMWDPSIFSLFSFIFFFLSWKETNRGLENENFKYCFSKRIFFYFFFLASFSLVSLFDGNNGGGYEDLLGNDLSRKILFAPLIAIVVISVTFFLVGYFFLNPKKDLDLIERLLRKYSSPPYLNN